VTRAPAAALALALLAACATRDAAAPDGDNDPPVAAPPPRLIVPPAGQEIGHVLRFTDAAAHYVDVTSSFPAGGDLELMMAVWTPGSYLVREYSRHVEQLTAHAGDQPLAVTRTRKNRWRIAGGGAGRITVSYKLYARELSVRTNFVDPELAVLNGAATFLVPVGALDRAHDVRLELPAGWTTVATPLPAHPDGAAHHYLAPDFDTLVDSPLLAGTPELHQVAVGEAPHRLAIAGGGGAFDGAAAAEALGPVVRATIGVWGEIPYDHYWFLLALGDGGGGGLEHRGGTLLTGSRWAWRTLEDRIDLLSLCAHELFHAWNGKRLRPVALGPFDYENEVYTDDLWMVEGVTSYYDDLIVTRAGAMSHARYLERLSGAIDSLENTPGRAVMSAAAASRDAWIKYYRPDENSANSSINYYTKGAVVGFLLDAEIRRRTRGARSLDDALRLAYRRHAGARGYSSAELRATLAEVAGGSLDDFFAAAVDGTGALDYAAALDWYGLRFAAAPKPPTEPAGWLGAGIDGNTITEVRRDTPAARAGLSVGDELLAIDELRIPADGLEGRLSRYRPGTAVKLLVARRGQLRTLPATLGDKPAPRKLESLPGASAEQRARRNAWLGPDHPDP
jgi:predicted metalloprotease with PDZ domain